MYLFILIKNGQRHGFRQEAAGGKQEAEKADFGTYESGMHEVAFCGEPLTGEKGHTGVCPS